MIISIAQAQLYFLVFTRIMATIIHVPVLGGQGIPNQVRIGLGLLLAAVLIPWQPLSADVQSLSLLAFTIAIAKEIIIGTLAGFAADMVFGAAQIAAETMGLGSGFSSGRVFNPTFSESTSAFDQVFIMVSMMVFLLINGHHGFLLGLQRSFEILPVNGEIPFNSMEALLRTFAELVGTGVRIALPVMAALFLTDLALGLLARVAPQVQVFFLGLPLKVGVSLFAMGLLFMVIFPTLSNLYQSIGERMLYLLEN